MKLSIVRYDILDGCVNDAFTIHRGEGEVNSDMEALAYVQEHVGGTKIKVDNSGDFGDRFEFLDEHGDPAGALVIDQE